MTFETIHNFYEKLILKTIENVALYDHELSDDDFLEDVACCALNDLPAKYVRHDVDLMFYMTSNERDGIEDAAKNAVLKAIEYVRSHRRSPNTQASIKPNSKKIKRQANSK